MRRTPADARSLDLSRGTRGAPAAARSMGRGSRLPMHLFTGEQTRALLPVAYLSAGRMTASIT